MRVLVLDGDQRSALAVTRSLGRSAHEVVLASPTEAAPWRSRFVAASARYTDPTQSIAGFLEDVRAASHAHGIDLVLPLSDPTVTSLIDHPELLYPNSEAVFPEAVSFHNTVNKLNLARQAEALGLAVPANPCLTNGRHDYPYVVKPAVSVYPDGDCMVRTSVSIVRNAEDERAAMKKCERWAVPMMRQAYIEGEGRGVFALYDRGRAVLFFGHRRLREKPPWGGVSVLSESCEPDPAMLASARTLLDAVGWHGVAMAEYKRAADGTPYLMEVNGRFWGSLQLAVDSGCDFPALLMQTAAGKPIDHCGMPIWGKRLRWLLGDLDSLLITLRGAAPLPTKWHSVRRFLTPDPQRTRHEVWRRDDSGPGWQEFRGYLRQLLP